MMVTLSSQLFLRGVILAFLVGITLQSTEGLQCWVCDGYDNVPNQCSPANNGKLQNCTGSNPTCELKEDRYNNGAVYILRKCANGIGNAPRPGTCAPSEMVSSVNVTLCYCDKDNCNFDKIDGRGGNSHGRDPGPDEGGSGGMLIAIVIIVVVVALLVVGGLGYRWYSGRSRRSDMGEPIPSDD